MNENFQAMSADHAGGAERGELDSSSAWCVRVRRLITVFALGLLVASCASSAESVMFESFTSDGVTYEFGIFPNSQGPDAPCVGVSSESSAGLTTQLVCPTETAEETEYAAVIDFRGVAFLVGFGLEEGESVVVPDAVRVLSTEPVDGRRFFLVQLAEVPGSEPFGVPVEKPDGTMRSIPRV